MMKGEEALRYDKAIRKWHIRGYDNAVPFQQPRSVHGCNMVSAVRNNDW